MQSIKYALFSSLGKKFLVALTGLALGLFVIVHLLGNLTLFKSEGSTFNLYANSLHEFGIVLIFAEIVLALVIITHAVFAIWLKLTAHKARPTDYKLKQSKKIIYSNKSSRHMIITGMILLAFLIFHIIQFRFGPNIEQGYTTGVHGVQMRDLHRLVYEVFQNPFYVAIYVGAMLFLGFHLRHGYWSLFQSLGVMNPRLSKPVYIVSTTLAVLLALGFLFIPIWIYFDIGQTIHLIATGGAN